MSINNRELFSEWLNCKSINKPPINLILLAFDEVSEFAISRKLSKVSIWSISSQSDFKFVRVAVSKNQILRVVHKQAYSLFEKSWKYYDSFLASLKEMKNGYDESNESAIATQPKWNRHESALLLEGCLKIQRGEDRKTIIKELSKTLRKMGERAGYSIDEIFRNENGIAWQMKRMEIALSGKVCDVKPNKVFIEVANLSS